MSKSQETVFTRRRLRSSYITTVLSISLALFMLGLMGLIVIHGQKLAVTLRESIAMSVIMKNDVRESAIIALQKRLEISPFVKSAVYITREEAAKDLMESLGEDFISFLGYNPLLPSIEIKLNVPWTSVDSLMAIEKRLLENPIVKEVVYQKSLVNLINENIQRIGMALSVLTIILLFIAIALINNTIRLSVYSKRFLIRSMQLVGATSGFVTRPFIVRGLLNGLYSSLIAILLLSALLWYFRNVMPDLTALQDIRLILALFGALILTGLFMSWISTYFAVRKHLRSRLDDLYLY
ncbi:MAG TPA: permease-like cell division protein FtsX [Bacteroidales bacterium]|nr:permease-like cell division protein FtsX [Bacteroidales bacterium]